MKLTDVTNDDEDGKMMMDDVHIISISVFHSHNIILHHVTYAYIQVTQTHVQL